MNRVRDKRVIAAVALLALLLAGAAAFAIFRETLQARIEVATGKFDFSIRNATVVDNEPKEPDIAKCEAKIAGDGKSVNITISNAYPLYRCTVNLTVENVGTIHGRYENASIEVPAALSVNVTAPPGIIAPKQRVNVVIVVSVTGAAEEDKRYSASVVMRFRQALP
ncbi:MAG: hypothetical protein N3F67_05005 [Acidilobaceae archaeon]|nr:hypothetical protein [Acidilobaceae archaeon]